jgi:hypothetical protein
MERKKLMVVALVAATALIIATTVSASSFAGSPLFSLRMEQQSSKMNFLPTEIKGFTYAAESKSCLTLDMSLCCNAVPLGPEPTSEQNPCEHVPPNVRDLLHMFSRNVPKYLQLHLWRIYVRRSSLLTLFFFSF